MMIDLKPDWVFEQREVILAHIEKGFADVLDGKRDLKRFSKSGPDKQAASHKG